MILTFIKGTGKFFNDLFAIIADIPTTENAVVQSMPADSIRLLEIYSVKNGEIKFISQ